MITRFHGINISSPDPGQLVKFYNEQLGIPILQKDVEGFGVADGFSFLLLRT